MNRPWLWLILIAILLWTGLAYADGLPTTLNREWIPSLNLTTSTPSKPTNLIIDWGLVVEWLSLAGIGFLSGASFTNRRSP